MKRCLVPGMILLAALSCGRGGREIPPRGPDTVVSLANELRVRAEPDTAAEVVATAAFGERMLYREGPRGRREAPSTEQRWTRLALASGEEGWVASAFVCSAAGFDLVEATHHAAAADDAEATARALEKLTARAPGTSSFASRDGRNHVIVAETATGENFLVSVDAGVAGVLPVGSVWEVRWSPDPSLVALVASDGEGGARLYAFEAASPVPLLEEPARGEDFAFDAEGQVVTWLGRLGPDRAAARGLGEEAEAWPCLLAHDFRFNRTFVVAAPDPASRRPGEGPGAPPLVRLEVEEAFAAGPLYEGVAATEVFASYAGREVPITTTQE